MCGELVYATKITQLWIESVLYGLYINLFAGCVYIYTKRRSNRYTLWMCIAMFTTCTAEVFVDLVNVLLTPRLISGSDLVSDTLFPCEVSLESTRQSSLYQRIDNVAFILFTTKLWLGDSVLVYRCYMVWTTQRWIAMIPAFLLFVTMVFGYAQVGMSYKYYHAQLLAQASSSAADTARVININLWMYRLNTVATATSVATNIIVTVLVVYRIWRDTRQLAATFGSRATRRYDTAIVMIIESGALYTASLLAELISNNVDGDAAYVANYVSDSLTAMLVLIAPSLIIIRIGLNQGYVETFGQSTSTEDPSMTKPAHSIVFAPKIGDESVGNETSLTGRASIAMLDFEVESSPTRQEYV